MLAELQHHWWAEFAERLTEVRTLDSNVIYRGHTAPGDLGRFLGICDVLINLQSMCNGSIGRLCILFKTMSHNASFFFQKYLKLLYSIALLLACN